VTFSQVSLPLSLPLSSLPLSPYLYCSVLSVATLIGCTSAMSRLNVALASASISNAGAFAAAWASRHTRRIVLKQTGAARAMHVSTSGSPRVLN